MWYEYLDTTEDAWDKAVNLCLNFPDEARQGIAKGISQHGLPWAEKVKNLCDQFAEESRPQIADGVVRYGMEWGERVRQLHEDDVPLEWAIAAQEATSTSTDMAAGTE